MSNKFANAFANTVDPQLIDTFTPLGYEPSARQQVFHDLSRQRIHAILYGGAAGGGKSCALLHEAIHCAVNYPGMRIGCFRRTYNELEESFLAPLISQWGQAKAVGAVYNASQYLLKFNNGSVINFSYAESEKDVSRILGGEYQLFCVDEAGQTPERVLQQIEERLRSGRRSLPVIGIRYACVDEGDVLTAAGWKPIQDVQVGETVYSVNRQGELQVKKVIDTFAGPCDEPLVRVRSPRLYMSMTQNHRVVYRDEQNVRVDPEGKQRARVISPTYDIIPWNEHTKRTISVARAPKTWTGAGYQGVPLADWSRDAYLAFLGLFLAEGSTNTRPLRSNYKTIITQCKTENHQVIRNLLDCLPHKYNYSRNGDFQITNKAVWQHFRQFGKSGDKFIPREILETATHSELAYLWAWMSLGDGHTRSGQSYSNAYTTTSLRLKDDVCELALKLGYTVNVCESHDGHSSHAVKYQISVTDNLGLTRIQKNSHTDRTALEEFSGTVYCIKVEDNENFVIRQHGYVWLSGNTNPGGISHSFIRKRFIDTTQDGKLGVISDKNQQTIAYVPAKVTDNPHVDAGYEKVLDAIPDPIRRRQMRDGDWRVVVGAFFEQWNSDLHIVTSFQIDPTWRRFCGIDYGIRDPWAVIWAAQDPDGRLWCYREIYSTGIDVKVQGKFILDAEQNAGETEVFRFADPSIWGNLGTNLSIADYYGMVGCGLGKATNNRPNGWTKVHHFLNMHAPACEIHKKQGMSECPMLHVFGDRCPMFVETVPALPRTELKTDDAKTKNVPDHMPDALRYMLSGVGSTGSPVFYDEVQPIAIEPNQASEYPSAVLDLPRPVGRFAGNLSLGPL